MLRGKVKFYSAEKGFGFATLDDGTGDVFIGARMLAKCDVAELETGDVVDVDVSSKPDGRRFAEVLEIVRRPAARPVRVGGGW